MVGSASLLLLSASLFLSRVALEKLEGQITEAVNCLGRQKELKRVGTSLPSLVSAVGMLLTMLVAGALMEWMETCFVPKASFYQGSSAFGLRAGGGFAVGGHG